MCGSLSIGMLGVFGAGWFGHDSRIRSVQIDAEAQRAPLMTRAKAAAQCPPARAVRPFATNAALGIRVVLIDAVESRVVWA